MTPRPCLHAPSTAWPNVAGPGDDDDDDETPIGDPDDDDGGDDEDDDDDEEDTLWARPVLVAGRKSGARVRRVESAL